ncbi:hypothetical protein Ciccas_007280 [Cichlidogyrus casuarinus]|uniref:Uncharacterized protein n=1 Tax=Cichlidogyrus casuarinus TaxID=1844966 RepID=A0ABD2Q3H4_9PLAT
MACQDEDQLSKLIKEVNDIKSAIKTDARSKEQLATLSAEQLALMEGIVNKAGEASERTRRKSSLLIMNLPKGITRTQIEAAFLLLKFPAVSGVSRVGRAQKGMLQPMRIFFRGNHGGPLQKRRGEDLLGRYPLSARAGQNCTLPDGSETSLATSGHASAELPDAPKNPPLQPVPVAEKKKKKKKWQEKALVNIHGVE